MPPPVSIAPVAIAPVAPIATTATVALAPPPPHARGDTCGPATACASGLECLAAPGGYCASSCAACADGTCVETDDGARCLASCVRDDDCRADEGYACDVMWHACAIPNTTALVPRTCPLPAKVPVRDPAFAAPVAVPDGDGRSPRFVRGVLEIDRGDAPRAHDPDDCGDGACGDATVVTAGPRAVAIYAAGGGLRVRVSSDGGATFARPITPVTGNAGDVALGSADRVHVVALVGSPAGAYGSADHRLDYVVSLDGGRTFTHPVTISGPDDSIPFYLANPTLALDERRGYVYVAYARGHRLGVWDIAIAVGTMASGKLTWTRKSFGDACALHALPALAVDDRTGTLHVAWYDSRGDHGRYAHATCGPGAYACTQRGAISEPFTVPLSTAHASPSYLGTRSALAIDAAHRTIRAAWVEQDGGRAHVVTADGKVN